MAEDYSGLSPGTSAEPRPAAVPRLLPNALDDAGIGFDVYDVDANGRTAPSYLGVLSHYKAVVWYTGDDLYRPRPEAGPRRVAPPPAARTGTEKLFDDEILASRDYMNEGGKLLVTGKTALEGAWEQFLYNPLGPDAAEPAVPAEHLDRTGRSGQRPAGPELQLRGGRPTTSSSTGWAHACPSSTSTRRRAAARRRPCSAALTFGLNGADSARQPGQPVLAADDVEHPQARHVPAVQVRPGGQGRRAAGLRPADRSAVRLLAAGRLDLQAPDAHGRPDRQDVGRRCSSRRPRTPSRTSTTCSSRPTPSARTTGRRCPTRTATRARTPASAALTTDPFWLQENPFLRHYITRTRHGPARQLHADRHERGVERGDRATRPGSRTGTST